jgi:hypothetical protein
VTNRPQSTSKNYFLASKWVYRVNMYTDAVYFEHSEAGETSWTPPMYWEEE